MKQKIITTLTLILLLTSCASTLNVMNTDSNMKKLKIGMTKEEVVSIVGNHYEIIGANKHTEMIGYQYATNEIYILKFENNKLVEWHKEWLRQERFSPIDQN